MVNEILDKLKGKNKQFERFESQSKPSRNIILGSLADSNKDESTDDQSIKPPIKNNSLSVKFLLKDIKDKFTVIPKLSVYYRVYPTYDEQMGSLNEKEIESNEKVNLAFIWKRKDIIFDPINFEEINDTNEYLNFKNVIDFIKNGSDLFISGNDIPIESLKDEKAFLEFIEGKKSGKGPDLNWECYIYLNIDDLKQANNELNLIEIGMLNDTNEDTSYETFFFDCQLEIQLNKNELIPFVYDYKYENYPETYNNFLRCLNCHADYNNINNSILTHNFAKFEQIKIIPRINMNDLILEFKDLMHFNGLKLLENLYESMETHYKKCLISTKKDSKYVTNLENFYEIKNRFKIGIDILKENENALKAFLLLNKTFDLNSHKYKSWRLFQIVFIVSLIPDIVEKKGDQNKCDLLHVMTGGGKSEAYFGLVIFSAFFDRITGKKFGMTAITKFPLRMLSIQQLQRIASLFIWAEEIRQEEKIGGEPFSIAYFVGQSDEFPRFNNEIVKQIKKSKNKNSPIKGKIVDKCPICQGNVILDFDSECEIIIHKCEECNRQYRLFFTDEEIYRIIPTFLICTVDKLAGVAMNRRFKNLFGGKLDKCPNGHGFVPRNDFCEAGIDKKCKEYGNPVNVPFNTGPYLIIQDEMHLIKEGFGTIDSHFESFFEAMQYEFSGQKFKYIAMTATTTGAEEQIFQLYNKKIRIFPSKLSDEEENDFFFEVIKEDGKETVQRNIIGLKPNYRDNHTALMFTLRYYLEFIDSVSENIENFARDYEFELSELKKILLSYKNILSYHNKKSDVHLMKYYLDDMVNKSDNYTMDSLTLTGDNTLEYIKEAINKVNHFYENPINDNKILSVFATSIVSHGVDIDKWNIMLFQGMPRSTSEYIQALSRVGRSYPGIVFLWFYPTRTRDTSFYQNFVDYHNILEHKVENVPLSRWAKLGFKQTFTSIFNASILNYLSNKLEKPLYGVPDVIEALSDKNNSEDLIEFIKKAYISKADALGAEYFDDMIEKETNDRITYLEKYSGNEKFFFPNALRDNDNKYYKTQFGMRGIQDEVVLSPNFYDISFISRFREMKE